MTQHRQQEVHPQQPNQYIDQADKDYHGKNDNWTQGFVHEHYTGPGKSSSSDDNVRKTAAEAWARIKTDLRDGQVGSEDKDYWDRSKAAKDYVDLQKQAAAGGPEGAFAQKVLDQVQKLQKNLHEDAEMQKLGFAKYDHIFGADDKGRLSYDTKGSDGKYHSEKATAGALGDSPTETTTTKKSVTEGSEPNSDGSKSNVLRTDSNDKGPDGKPKASHTEYPDEDGKLKVNGRNIDTVRSVDRQFNDKTGGWDYKVKTKDGQELAYSADKDDKNARFSPTQAGNGEMKGKLDKSVPLPAGATDLSSETKTGDKTYEGKFNDGIGWSSAYKRTDETDAQGHLTKRTVDYDGRHGSKDVATLHDQNGKSLTIVDIKKAETVFDPKTGKYESTYTDGSGKKYHATLSGDFKTIEGFHD